MGLSNKLGVIFVGVNLLLPTLTQALVIEPVKIDSSQGEPLYAEIPFQNASDQSPIQVSMAQPFELGLPEAIDAAQLAHFNFYVRQNNQGNGVIVITSSRPIHESALNLVLKINDNGQIHMQPLRTKLPSRIDRLQSTLQNEPLKPRIVADEKNLELELPVSTTNAQQEQSLVISTTPPPLLSKPAPPPPSGASIGLATIVEKKPDVSVSPTVPSNTASAETLTVEITRRDKDGVVVTTPLPKAEPEEKPLQAANTTPKKEEETPKKEEKTPPSVATTQPKAPTQHTVKANDSLWEIASQIAQSQSASVYEVMNSIHQNNKDAFINEDMNRLKQGVVLNIPANFTAQQKTATTTPKAAPKTPAKPAAPTTTTTRNTNVTPKKQNEAHMSIVANTNKGAIQGADKTGGTNNKAQQHELTTQLKQARGSTLNLQNNVKQLDQQLREKEKRLALLNARLAELEQKLKSRQTPQTQPAAANNVTSSMQYNTPSVAPSKAVTFIGQNSGIATATKLHQELV